MNGCKIKFFYKFVFVLILFFLKNSAFAAESFVVDGTNPANST